MRPSGRRGSRSRRLAIALAIPLSITAVTVLAAVPSQAATPSGPTAIVSMGDSYISGEAGRWQGNSLTNSGSRDGTDRAWTGSGYDPTQVYGETYDNGCHRSDSAPVHSATDTTEVKLNIACSGATTEHIFRSSNGGKPYKGESPQADQLATIAANYNVKVIALSIGGNDLDFAGVIAKCAADYTFFYSYCHDDQQRAVDSRMDTAMAAVGTSIDEIRAVMSANGYTAADYRIVLQSYPSPIPRSTENRYPESGWSRVDTGGCPFWDADADWARDSLVPQIASGLKAVATAKGAQFLDLRDMLQGREVCSTATRHATAGQPPSPTAGEWVRWMEVSGTQGRPQESMHPNYYGQLAQGRCLSLLYARPTGSYACRNSAGGDASGMYLSSVS
ncbi:GDSL-type esterase/lipase family protein [Streptomyces sp. KR80]|uniref:GDSL-type esterase/lipase family protein n=1 Tax=Streptomyces sp. KR80 TaxID=3457426 RepID=UPI003FD299CF